MKHRRYFINYTEMREIKGLSPYMGWPAPHLVTGRKAADTEGQQHPPTSVRGLGGVHRQLLADLTVNLIPELRFQDTQANDKVEFLQIVGGVGDDAHLVFCLSFVLLLHYLCNILQTGRYEDAPSG